MINKNYMKTIDFNLIAIVLLLFISGMIMITSATDAHVVGMTREVRNQGLGFFIGLVAMIVAMSFDYKTFKDFNRFVYILSILIMLTVYIPGLGVIQFGARSWIDLGILYFQPAEIAKIGFVLTYAHMLEERKDTFTSLQSLIVPMLHLAPFVLLLLLQPDLGTALVFVFIAVGMLFCAGLSYKIILGGIITAAISLPVAYMNMLPHQKQRIDAFLNPNDPNLQGNYQVMQSKITIGSGMFLGRGLFKGVYHRYDYLPVRETDFIFAVLGEELGFVGGAFIIFLYFLLMMRMLTISIKSKDDYGSLVVIGVVFMFAFQIFENIGMTMGIMPVTGVTLPFLSYGGSSLITSMLAIGIVLNVYMRRMRGSFLYMD